MITLRVSNVAVKHDNAYTQRSHGAGQMTRSAEPHGVNPALEAEADGRHPILASLGERVRTLRAQRGLTRKAVALAADVSERHLANLEYGTGNASVLILQQIADALHCSLAELLGDFTTQSPEWLLLRDMLEPCSEAELRRVRVQLGEILGSAPLDAARPQRIALIGLRGAGKSTLGQMLAENFDVPFIELSREIERLAGCSVREIYDLYGTTAYRRYERRALDEVVQNYGQVVIATPGGIVSEPATFNQLLAHCTTVWLQAAPDEHMGRVVAQGDTRPIAASTEAMEDLRRILRGRAAFYSKADLTVDTAGQTLEQSFRSLLHALAATPRDGR